MDVVESDVVFLFEGGRLGYDCAGCQENCCRGNGYFVQAGHEMEVQREYYAHIDLFANRQLAISTVGSGCYVRNLKPRCFFSLDDGRCRIHVEHGLGSKPETCRLFPFNGLRVAGRFLLVSPHPRLCPLEVAKSGERAGESDYQYLFEQMALRGIMGSAEEVYSPAASIDDTIATERHVVSLAERYLERGFDEFVVSQLELSGTGCDLALRHELARSAYRRFRDRLRDTLGVWPRLTEDDCAEIDRIIIAMTPILRSYLLFRPLAEKQPAAISPPQIVFAIVALRILCLLAAEADGSVITYQTVSTIFHDLRPFLLVLAHCDEAMTLRRDRAVELDIGLSGDSAAGYAALLKELVRHRDRVPVVSLGELIVGTTGPFSGLRDGGSHAICGSLIRSMIPVSDSRTTAERRNLRCAIQHAVLRRIPSRHLARVGEVLARR